MAKTTVKPKPKAKDRAPRISASVREKSRHEEIRRLLGDQRTGVSITATPALEGAAGIFWLDD
jgi:hypothetical protein